MSSNQRNSGETWGKATIDDNQYSPPCIINEAEATTKNHTKYQCYHTNINRTKVDVMIIFVSWNVLPVPFGSENWTRYEAAICVVVQ